MDHIEEKIGQWWEETKNKRKNSKNGKWFGLWWYLSAPCTIASHETFSIFVLLKHTWTIMCVLIHARIIHMEIHTIHKSPRVFYPEIMVGLV